MSSCRAVGNMTGADVKLTVQDLMRLLCKKGERLKEGDF